jgi:acylphosphatase
MICKRVIYTGRVQGVGFRYTAVNVADGYAVAGYVRNLPDGSVELVAEGEPDQVEACLAAVAGRMAGYVKHAAVMDEAPQGYHGFQVRY